MKEDHIMTVKQASEFIGVHTNTIYSMIEDGRLKAEKHGKSYKIDHMSVLDVYMAQSIVDEEKQVLLGICKVKEDIKSDLRFSAGKTFQEIRDILDKFEKLKEEHTEKLKKDCEEFEKKIKEDPDKISETCERNRELLDKPYDIQNELILKLKQSIDKHFELYNFYKKMEEYHKEKSIKGQTVDEVFQLLKSDFFKYK